jgi:hypothetical protein
MLRYGKGDTLRLEFVDSVFPMTFSSDSWSVGWMRISSNWLLKASTSSFKA